MKLLEEIKNILTKHKEELMVKYKVKELGVFGSFLRGEQNKKSDIDILIDFHETPDLFTFIENRDYISRKLGKKVDLVMKDSLKPNIGKIILREVIYL